MNDHLEWYQFLMGILLIGAVTCIVPIQKFTKILWADFRELWRESNDSLWAKLFQSAVFLLGYILLLAAVYYAMFRLGALLFVWWQGTLGSAAVLALCALVVLFARHQRAAARKRDA